MSISFLTLIMGALKIANALQPIRRELRSRLLNVGGIRERERGWGQVMKARWVVHNSYSIAIQFGALLASINVFHEMCSERSSSCRSLI